MGSDKALLTIQDETLLTRALNTAAVVAGRVTIVGPRESYATYGEVIEDVYADCGPLGGIHAALSATATDLNLVLSVDMPLMTAQFLGWLLERARKASEWMVVPDALGGQQPLCAVYRRPVQGLAEQALKQGDYKIGHMFSRAPTLFISETEMCDAGFSPEIFRNVNTAEEYEALVRDRAAILTKSEG
jgi:molybdenum cofactor guanylyltransferase